MTTPREPTTAVARPLDAARRQRERASVVLAQIVGRATRSRQLITNTNNANANNTPLTLIELIQASNAVFEKHGILAPDDAVFHRHLLTLSLDPEPDWKKKIQRFAVQKSNSDIALSPRASSVGSVVKSTQRRTSSASFQTPARRTSSESRTPRWIPPGSGTPTTARTPTIRTKRQSVDQFGDMLVVTTASKEDGLRKASTVEVGTATEDEPARDTPVTPAQKLRNLETIRSKLSAINAELTVDGQVDEADEDEEEDNRSTVDGQAFSDSGSGSLGGSVRSIPPHAYYPSPTRDSTAADEDSRSPIESPVVHRFGSQLETRDFRRLATVFQQWRELTTFHRLVRDSRQRELRLTQAVLPPIATFAIFRWIGLTLPRRDGSYSPNVSLAVPMYVLSRGVASSNPRLLRHFTGRLLVWTIHRIFKVWAVSARATKTVRIKSLIRLRTSVLETAFTCLHQWRRFVVHRRRAREHGVWVETLHARKCLRRSLSTWRNELENRKRELDALGVYQRRRISVVWRLWRRKATQYRMTRALGAQRRLKRSLQAWRLSIRWSEEEHRQNVLARKHFSRRVLRRCWSVWRTRTSEFKRKRFRISKATHYNCIITIRRFWTAWQEGYRERKALAHKRVRFQHRKQTHLLRSVLTSFAAFVQNKKCNTLVVLDACARRDQRRIQRVWKAWTSYFQASVEDDEARIRRWKRHRIEQVWTRWKRQTSVVKVSAVLQSYFDASVTQSALSHWKQWVEKQRYYRSLLGDWRGERDHILKAQVFHAFQENVQIGRGKQHAVQVFLHRCADTRLQSYVSAWREVARTCRIQRCHDEKRIENCYRIQLRRRWTTWRLAFHVAHSIQLADVAMAQGIRRRYFQKWLKTIRVRKTMTTSSQLLRQYQLKRAVRQLHTRAKATRDHRQLASILAVKRDGFLMLRGWKAWQSGFNIVKQRHGRVAKAVLQWQNRVLALYFVEWKANHLKRKELLALLSSWQQGARDKSVCVCWKAWQEYVALKHEKRAALAEAQQYFERRSLKRAIRQWHLRFQHSQDQLVVIQKCVGHWTCGLTFRIFNRWKQVTHLRRMLRVLNSRSDNKRVQKCFDHWKTWKYRRDTTAWEADELTMKLRDWTLRRAVKRFRLHAIASKRLSSLQGLVKLAGSRGVQTALFRRWVTYTTACRQLKTTARTRELHMLRFRALRCLQQWEHFVRLKQLLSHTLLQAKARNTSMLALQSFTKWRQFVSDRKLFNALKEKALVFQVFSMLPRYFNAWKQYVAVQHRKQHLVAMASRQFSHQREAKAFKTWSDWTKHAAQARKAIHVWRNQALQCRFVRWKTFVTQQNAKTRAMMHRERVTKRRVLCAWHEAAHRERLLEHFRAMWHAQTTEQCFRHWAKHVRVTKCARSLLRRLQYASLTRVLNSWKAFIDSHRSQTSQIQHRFALLWNQDRTMTSFQRWKALAKQQRNLKKRTLQRLSKQTSVCFARWRAVVASRKRDDDSTAQLRKRHGQTLLAAFWTTWKKKKAMHDTANVLRRRLLQQSFEANVRVLFHSWRAFAHKEVATKAAHQGHRKRRLLLLFSNWRDRFVVRMKQERSIVEMIQKRQDVALVKRVILRMRARMTIKNACTRVFLPQLQRHLLTQAWRSWTRYHAHKRMTRDQVGRLSGNVRAQDQVIQDAALASLTRWRALQQAQSFAQWKSVSQHLQWMRFYTVEAMQTWRTKLCAAVFRSWKQWIQQQKHKKRIQASCTRHRRARVWKRWIQYHQNQQLQTFLCAKAQRFHRRCVQLSVLAVWQSVVARQRHFALLAASLTLHRTQRALRQWHGYAVSKRSERMQWTVANAAARYKRLSSAYHEWTRFVTDVRRHRLELQQQTERLQVLILCSTFRAWRAWSQRQRKIVRMLGTLSDRCDAKTAKRVFLSWSTFAKATRFTRLAVSRFVWKLFARKGIRALRINALGQIAKRNEVQKAREWIEVLQGRFVRRSFLLWQHAVVLRKQKRRAIHHYQTGKLLPGVFNAWKAFVQERRRKNERLERAVKCWRSVFACRAWNAWTAYHTEHLKKHQTLVRATNHVRDRRLRQAIDGWRSVIVQKQRLNSTCRSLLVRWKMQSIYRSFSSWHSYALRCKASRVSAAIVSSRFGGFQLRHAWSEWRLQFVVARVGSRKHVARVFDRWQQWCRQRREWAAFQATQSHVLLQNVRARHGVRRWKAFVVQTKLAKTMTLLSSRFSNDTLAKRCFEQWLAFLVSRHRDKDKMKHVLQWMRNRQLVRCFQALAAYATRQQHKERARDAAVAHATHRALRRAFVGWKTIISVTKHQRLKLRRYVDVMQHVTQRKSFVAWREFATKRVQLRTTFANIIAQRSTLTSQTVFDDWKVFTQKAKRRKAAEMFRRQHLGIHSLCQWRNFVILSRVERMLGAGEQRLVERCFVGWRKRAAIHQHVRTLGRAKAERDRTQTLKQHVLAWHSWVRLQSSCTKLLGRVAIGYHLRYRFLMWKLYAQKSKRLKRLVLGSEPPPSITADSGSSQAIVPSVEQPAVRLARMARGFQQFRVDWSDTAAVWQRWRHVFHACLFYRMRRLYKLFSVWRTWSRRRRRVKTLCHARLAECQRTQTRALFMRWRDVVVTVKRIQRERRRERELLVIVNTELLRRDRKVLQQHWKAWRERTENKRHLLVSVDSYQRARVLTKYWLLWSHDFVNAMALEHQRDASYAKQLAVVKAKRVIQRLHERRHWRINARYVVSTMKTRRHERWYRLCVEEWKRVADTRRKARLLMVFKKRQTLLRAYQAWCHWMSERRLQEQAIRDYVVRRVARSCASTFLKWRQYVLHRRQHDDAMIVATRFHLGRCIRSRWYQTIQTRMRRRQTLEQQGAALETWRQQRAVQRWRSAARNRVLQKRQTTFVRKKFFHLWKLETQQSLADRFCDYLGHKRVRAVFSSWVRVASQQHQLRKCEIQVRRSNHKRRLRHVWAAWEALVQSTRNERIAQEHYDSIVKRRVFLSWSDTAMHMAVARNERMAVADAFRVYSLQRSVLHRWVFKLIHARQRKAVLLSCVIKIQHAFTKRLQQAILHAWADAADLERFKRDCASILQQRRMHRAIQRWHRKRAERCRTEQLHRNAQVYHQRRLVSAVYFHWQNYALAWKDAERVTRRSPVVVPTAVQDLDSEGDDDDASLRFRRPLSPMNKRLNANGSQRDGPTCPLDAMADAASLSLHVKKRLLVLGKWKPAHTSLSQV